MKKSLSLALVILFLLGGLTACINNQTIPPEEARVKEDFLKSSNIIPGEEILRVDLGPIKAQESRDLSSFELTVESVLEETAYIRYFTSIYRHQPDGWMLVEISQANLDKWSSHPLEDVSDQDLKEGLYGQLISLGGQDLTISKENLLAFEIIEKTSDLTSGTCQAELDLTLLSQGQLAQGQVRAHYTYDYKWKLISLSPLGDFVLRDDPRALEDEEKKAGEILNSLKGRSMLPLDPKASESLDLVFQEEGFFAGSLSIKDKADQGQVKIQGQASYKARLDKKTLELEIDKLSFEPATSKTKDLARAEEYFPPGTYLLYKEGSQIQDLGLKMGDLESYLKDGKEIIRDGKSLVPILVSQDLARPAYALVDLASLKSSQEADEDKSKEEILEDLEARVFSLGSKDSKFTVFEFLGKGMIHGLSKEETRKEIKLCNFQGSFDLVKKLDPYCYEIDFTRGQDLPLLDQDKTKAGKEISNGSELYGLAEKTYQLYLPGTPAASLPNSLRTKRGLSRDQGLESYLIYNPQTKDIFVEGDLK